MNHESPITMQPSQVHRQIYGYCCRGQGPWKYLVSALFQDSTRQQCLTSEDVDVLPEGLILLQVLQEILVLSEDTHSDEGYHGNREHHREADDHDLFEARRGYSALCFLLAKSSWYGVGRFKTATIHWSNRPNYHSGWFKQTNIYWIM